MVYIYYAPHPVLEMFALQCPSLSTEGTTTAFQRDEV